MGRGRRAFACFLPAASAKALTSISRTVRRWALHHRSDKSLQDLAEMYNPCIRGWINYYSHFYKTQLRPTLKRIDLYVIRWARRKFKRLRRKTKGARDWFDRLRRVNPTLFAHWRLCHGNGRTSGRMNREVHVRIWERPEVRLLRATRHEYAFPPHRPNAGYVIGKETVAWARGSGRDAPEAAVPVDCFEAKA